MWVKLATPAIEVEMHRNSLLQEEKNIFVPLRITEEQKTTLLQKLENDVLKAITMDIRTNEIAVNLGTIGKYIEEFFPKKELGVDSSSNALDIITDDTRQSIYTKANLLFEMIESSMSVPLSKEYEEEEEKEKKRKRGRGMGR